MEKTDALALLVELAKAWVRETQHGTTEEDYMRQIEEARAELAIAQDYRVVHNENELTYMIVADE